MKLKGELCALRRKLSQRVGWTIALDAVGIVLLYGIVLFNSHERSEFTSLFTSIFTSIFTSFLTSNLTPFFTSLI